MSHLKFLVVIFQLFASNLISGQYQPTWDSLDSRPLPQWFDESKIGIFVNWGVYSVPGFESEWFWNYWQNQDKNVVEFMKKNYPPDFTYADFAALFKAEFFDPNRWADIFKTSGAKYVVFSSKHHEGYTMWPSKVSWNWNSMDVGPKRDLIGELAAAVRSKEGIHFGLYHSMMDWYHPKYLQDKANNWATNSFLREKCLPELMEIVNAYKPDVIWSDGDWEAPDTYWNSTAFLAWLYNESPVKDTVVTNDRWGKGLSCKHGGYYTCADRYNPGVLQKHKWENCMTIDKYSWGYRRNSVYNDYLKIEELLSEIVSTVSCGGNILINVGPTADGMISPIYEERLTQMGEWLGVNGEAIFSTKPWTAQNDTLTKGVWYTSKKEDSSTNVYAITLGWPKDGILTLGAVNYASVKSATLLGYKGELKMEPLSKVGIKVTMPSLPDSLMPCKWAWVVKFITV